MRKKRERRSPGPKMAGRALLLSAMVLILGGAALTAQSSDDIWRHFENWVRTSPAGSGGGKSPLVLYAEDLAAEGFGREEADRRVRMIRDELRTKDRAHSAVYWDAWFKFGGGPGRPLRLLKDVVRDLRPGAALDVAMGNGRNALYLASLGWRVTGYDISPEAVGLARERTREMGLALEIVQAGHREFEYGADRWDLIVMSYNVADAGDLEAVFGRTLWDSLRLGGRIVCEGNFCEPLVRNLFALRLPGFRLERYEDTEDVGDGWGTPGVKSRMLRAVIKKDVPTAEVRPADGRREPHPSAGAAGRSIGPRSLEF